MPGTEALQLAPGHNTGWIYSFLTLYPQLFPIPRSPWGCPFPAFFQEVGVGAGSSPPPEPGRWYKAMGTWFGGKTETLEGLEVSPSAAFMGHCWHSW